jgi:uncharacterized LabA/DUF88 family protein
MKTNVYIDAFNLYYGPVRGTRYKWLDLSALCQIMLPGDSIHRIKYFTALVHSRAGDRGQGQRQQFYLRALRTIPNLSIYMGHFLVHTVSMPLESNPSKMVKVIKSEEKGSDVNLATELLMDAFHNDFEAAAIITNDSDLLRPIATARRAFGKTVGVLYPHNDRRHPSIPLRREADFFKEIRSATLARCQFPETFTDATGRFHKPPAW